MGSIRSIFMHADGADMFLMILALIGRHSCELIKYFEGIEGPRKIKDGHNPATWMLEVTASAQKKVLGVDFAEVYHSNLQLSVLLRDNNEFTFSIPSEIDEIKLLFEVQRTEKLLSSERLASWIVEKINHSIGQDPNSKSLIGVLDIYGFESFKQNSYSNEDQQQSKPNSLTNAWPQSYRQSIDLYSSVQSPSLNFLGTPALSRFGSSFLSSSLTRRHTPEILPSYGKPLIPKDEPQQRRSSHSLLPPVPSRTSSLKKVITDQKSKDLHQLPGSGQSSFGQAVLNGINVLCGVGILSTPYAIQQGGWAGLSLLLIFGILSFYTGLLLRKCLDSQPGLETYPNIGQAAFGTVGHVVISVGQINAITLTP